MALDVEARIAEVADAAERAAERSEVDVARPDGVTLVFEPTEAERGLIALLGITAVELGFLWSVVAFVVEPRVAVNAQRVFGAPANFGVSIAQHVAWRELSSSASRALLAIFDAGHPLRVNGIVEPAVPGPLTVVTPWIAHHRIFEFLRGDRSLDPSLAGCGALIPATVAVLSDAQAERIAELRRLLVDQVIVVIEGVRGAGSRTAIAHAVHPRLAIAVDFARVAAHDADAVIRALRRESILLDGTPVLANFDEIWSSRPPGDELLLRLRAAIEQFPGTVAITTGSAITFASDRRTVVRIRWPMPDLETRRRLWQHALAREIEDRELDALAYRYELGAGSILSAVRAGVHRANQRTVTLEDVIAGVHDNITEQVGELLRRVDVTQTWEELVLPDDTLDDIRALVGRVRHAYTVLDRWGFRKKLARGTGVAALFSGPPGTGKTMVAGLVARELALDLYQVDLSRIVSKWVGETEKQLARVFAAAEAGNALLLFDEADALFAKRSAEVRSATDRYANLEVNYLLQRVESFGGVVILTTNLDASIDPALRRRLASHIVFPTPQLAERIALWKEMLSPLGPQVIDVRRLAEDYQHMTGANIRNAVLAAAFLAADNEEPLGERHLRHAARSEYRAMGHVLAKDHG